MIDGSFQETCGIFTGKNGELIANSSLKSIYRNRKLKPESMARPGSLLGCPVSTFLEASLGMLMFCGAKNLYLETVEWIITTSSLPEKWMFKQGDDVKNANMLERKVQYLILLAKKTGRVELPFLLVFAPLNHHDSIMVRDVLNYCTMFFEQVSFCTSLLIDREFFRFPKKTHTERPAEPLQVLLDAEEFQGVPWHIIKNWTETKGRSLTRVNLKILWQSQLLQLQQHGCVWRDRQWSEAIRDLFGNWSCPLSSSSSREEHLQPSRSPSSNHLK